MKRIVFFVTIAASCIFAFANTMPNITLDMNCRENNGNWGKLDTVYIWEDVDTLHISHRNTLHNCCARCSPILKQTNDTLFVYYEDISEVACFCNCNFTFDYKITGLPHQRFYIVMANRKGEIPVTGCSSYIDHGNISDTILIGEMPQAVKVDTSFVYNYEDVNVMPEFRHNNLKVNDYIKEHQHGREMLTHDVWVLVTFTVERDGSLSNVYIEHGSGIDDIDQDAISIIESMPKWIPGQRAGINVRVEEKLHIDYRHMFKPKNE